MWVLFAEIWICLLVAFALGWFCHWFLCCRNKQDNDSPSDTHSIDDTTVLEGESSESEARELEK